MTIAVISHQSSMLHEMGSLHPESPLRVAAIDRALRSSGDLLQQLEFYSAKPCSKVDLQRVHSSEYIEFIFESSPKEGLHWLDPDTAMNPHTLDAALHAAGAAIHAVDLVMKSSLKSQNASHPITQAFCNIRPPGHHAERNRAMGFCFFNNVAIAAQYAIEQYRIDRVAILDFDVHHGNGTEDIFKNNDHVMLCSTYQYPLYPGTPVLLDHPRLIHAPLAAGQGREGFRTAVEEKWVPAVEQFKPDIIFISAGFDAHRDDPLASLNLTEHDYFWVTSEIVKLSENYCDGRIVSCLEGGYNLQALGKSVVSHLQAMAGIKFQELKFS